MAKRQGRTKVPVVNTVSSFSFTPAETPPEQNGKVANQPYFRLPTGTLRNFIIGNIPRYLPTGMSLIPQHPPHLVKMQGGGATFRIWAQQEGKTGLVNLPPQTITTMVRDLIRDGRVKVADFVYSEGDPPESGLEGFVPGEINAQGLKFIPQG